MISLPGLARSLGRYDIAANILTTYAAFVDRGMLPNRFPDGGEAPEYNTADATLWMFHALEDYLQAKPDPELLGQLFPTSGVDHSRARRRHALRHSVSMRKTDCCMSVRRARN